jgi:hypothetical protein
MSLSFVFDHRVASGLKLAMHTDLLAVLPVLGASNGGDPSAFHHVTLGASNFRNTSPPLDYRQDESDVFRFLMPNKYISPMHC